MSRKGIIAVSFALVFLTAAISSGCIAREPSAAPSETPLLAEGPGTEVFYPVGKESGCVRTEGDINSSACLVGDDWNNQIWRAFASFNLSALAGRDVTSAKFIFKGEKKKGEPFATLGTLNFHQASWGKRTMVRGDYFLPAIERLGKFDTDSGEIDVTPYVQEAVSNGEDRFQVKAQFENFLADMDSEPDQIDLDMTLEVSYE